MLPSKDPSNSTTDRDHIQKVLIATLIGPLVLKCRDITQDAHLTLKKALKGVHCTHIIHPVVNYSSGASNY
jgi:hypothetical protein